MDNSRKDCPMRHENGNCTVAGGFCTSVNDPICEALHNAYNCGYTKAVRHGNDEQDNRLESDTVKNEPLTLDELREMDGEPVFLVDLVHKSDPETPNLWGGWIVFTSHNTNGFIPRGGGFFSNYGYGKTWIAYRHKPKEDMK